MPVASEPQQREQPWPRYDFDFVRWPLHFEFPSYTSATTLPAEGKQKQDLILVCSVVKGIQTMVCIANKQTPYVGMNRISLSCNMQPYLTPKQTFSPQICAGNLCHMLHAMIFLHLSPFQKCIFQKGSFYNQNGCGQSTAHAQCKRSAASIRSWLARNC